MSDKVVHDPIHGSIVIDGYFVDLLNRHEMQRLHSVKQLGLGNIVFPGANHTRFEHSMGVYHLSKRMCDVLKMDVHETDTVRAAGLLHDICHAPFSHTLEELMELITKKDHMELARDLIHGKISTYMKRDEDILGGSEPISEILESNGISSKEVCDLIAYPKSDLGEIQLNNEDQSFFSSKDYMHQIIHGPVDADQMDYLMRDAHYTGVKLGTIDLDRILSQMIKHNDKLVIKRGGTVAAEGLMVSRILMHSSVYYHKTIHIVEDMLIKSVEEAISDGEDFSEIHLMTDSDLQSKLIAHGGKSSELMRNILYRRLYKNAYKLRLSEIPDDDVPELVKISTYHNKKVLEEQIANRAGLDRSDVIVNIPPRSILLSNLKIGKTDVSILCDGRIKSLASLSPLAKSLQSRGTMEWAVTVSCPPDKKEAVGKVAKNVIGIE